MTRTFLRFAALSLAVAFGFTSLHAQTALASLRPVKQSNRVAPNADLGAQTQLTGHIPGWVSNGVASSKSVDLNANMELTVVLQRDPAVQAAFTQFLADQQTPGNPLYHQWITPEQVGTLFGPTASDLAAVTSWLTAQGLTVDEVQPNRIMINVHGTTSAVGSAFRTSFGYFPLNGTPRLSAVSEPFVPSGLAPVVGAVFGLTDLPLYPNSIRTGPKVSDAVAGSTATTPQPNFNSSSGTHYLSPGDFAIIYDSASVLAGGNKGAGANAHVAVIGRSRVAATDISEFAANMGIGSSYTLNTIIPTNGTDPGAVCTFATANTCSTGGDQGEQTLDVDRVVGNAPNVTVDLIVATSLSTALQWNVNSVKDPIMTISYGGCEGQSGGTSAALTYDGYYSTAAAEGISTFVSSGDSGANGCGAAFTAISTASTTGASPNYLCSSSYVTCVGGTEFIEGSSTYWSTTNTTSTTTGMLGSVLSYIPEGAWNEPGPNSNGQYLTAGTGGGASLAIAKPSWQTGTGTLADGHRDTPDVAYPAAGHDSYYACLDYQLGSYTSQGITSANNCTSAGGGYFFGFSGTSAAAPAMAGVAALLNTKLGLAQGNLNPLLYKLAAANSSVFHDVTPTTSGVGTSCSVTVPSVCNNSTPGASALSTTATGGVQGFLVTPGWDEATGLGSIDVANFLAAASSFSVTPASLNLSLVSGTTTGNTDVITFASLDSFGGFAGTVNYTCTVTNASGTAAGSCSLSATSGTLTAGSSATSTLTITTTPGTSGVLSVTVKGTSGAIAVTSSAITVNLAAPSFTVTSGSAITIAAGSTSGAGTVALSSPNLFTGAVSFTCTASSASITTAGTSTCSVTPVTLTAGGTATANVSLTTVLGTNGTIALSITGTGTTTGATLSTSTTATVNATVTPPNFTMSAPSALSINPSGATTGNTTSTTLTSSAFAGTVSFTCTPVATSGSPANPATCSASSVTLTSGGTATSTITVTSTTAHGGRSGPQQAGLAGWGVRGGAMLAMLLCLVPFRRRRFVRPLAAFIVLAFGMAALSGCSGGAAAPVKSSSDGTYTVTVTGSGTSAGAGAAYSSSTTFTLTITN